MRRNGNSGWPNCCGYAGSFLAAPTSADLTLVYNYDTVSSKDQREKKKKREREKKEENGKEKESDVHGPRSTSSSDLLP